MAQRISFRRLEVFHAVAQANSFTLAAGNLNLSQPAVSRTIAELEADLGVLLFERLGNSIRITSAGARLVEEFESVRSSMDRLIDLSSVLGEQATRIIRVAALPIYSETHLPALVAGFRRDRGDVDFVIEVLRHDAILSGLFKGEYDLALTSTPTAIGSIETHCSVPEEAVLVTPPDDPLGDLQRVAIADLQDRQFILFPPSCPFRQVLDDYFAAHDFRPDVRLHVRSSTLVTKLVAEGQGIAIVQKSAAILEPRPIRIVPLSDPFEWSLGVVSTRGAPQSEHVRQFIEFSKGHLGAPCSNTCAKS